MKNIDDLEVVISSLFSPILEFIYPLDWSWSEQMTKSKRKEKRYEHNDVEEDWEIRETNWDLIVKLYEEIFLSILEKGEFSILDLNEKSEQEKKNWLSQRENIDIFMMFAISETILDLDYTGDDERLKVFKLLCNKNPILNTLNKKKIISKIDNTQEKNSWNELFISPYTIYIEE